MLAALELDLEVFTGPFDLLLALVLREEIDLLELELADVVLAYLDYLEACGELDLETATEFIVLVAALLELKSRIMLSADDDQLLDIEPGEAAEELLARMLEARRYRGAARYLADRLAQEDGFRYRSAALPALLRSSVREPGAGSQDPELLARALGGLLRMPPVISVGHLGAPWVTVGERMAHLRTLLARGRFDFDEAVRDADRVTVAVTLFALLELYKRGEATWEQSEPFGEIAVAAGPAAGAVPPPAARPAPGVAVARTEAMR